jgi:hypothetical protein
MCGTCSYFYCKNCCQKYRTITGSRCKEARHAAEGASSTATNGTDSDPNTVEQQTDIQRDDWYDPTKPLTKEHYDAKQRAAQKHRENTNQMAEMIKLEDRMKKNISLVFWAKVRVLSQHKI